MVEKPTDPTSGSKIPPSSPSAGKVQKGTQSFPSTHGQIEAKPMQFLGMHFDSDQAKKLWSMLVQDINRQIQKEKEKALKALRKWRGGDEDE